MYVRIDTARFLNKKHALFRNNSIFRNYKIRGESKKVFLDLGQIEKCGFLHGVQHVFIITFQVFLGVVKFSPFLLYFMGNF